MSAELEQQFVGHVSGRLQHLHRTAFLLCGDATRADDLVQSTIISFYPSLAPGPDGRQPR